MTGKNTDPAGSRLPVDSHDWEDKLTDAEAAIAAYANMGERAFGVNPLDSDADTEAERTISSAYSAVDKYARGKGSPKRAAEGDAPSNIEVILPINRYKEEGETPVLTNLVTTVTIANSVDGLPIGSDRRTTNPVQLNVTKILRLGEDGHFYPHYTTATVTVEAEDYHTALHFNDGDGHRGEVSMYQAAARTNPQHPVEPYEVVAGNIASYVSAVWQEEQPAQGTTGQ